MSHLEIGLLNNVDKKINLVEVITANEFLNKVFIFMCVGNETRTCCCYIYVSMEKYIAHFRLKLN